MPVVPVVPFEFVTDASGLLPPAPVVALPRWDPGPEAVPVVPAVPEWTGSED